MCNDKRRFRVADVATVENLAEKLTGHTWCGCTGFRLEGIVFLNDSFSEDGASEWAVFRDGRQVESITFGWCDRAQAEHHIRAMLTGGGVEPFADLPRIQTPQEHGTCPCCA